MRWPTIRGSTVLLYGGLLLTGLVGEFCFAVEIIPATSQDITRALGPDSKGLNLTQDELPDLFTLTASRLDENAKKFIVEHVYQSGRWKGGKAVIEYARDLSYTLVSVYDREGNRQRIYSVRTNFTEHTAAQEEHASRPEPTIRENVPAESPVAPPLPPSVNSPKMVQAGGADSTVSYEWNEAKGVYMAVVTAAPAPTPTAVPSRAEPAAPAPTVASRVVTPAEPVRRRRKRHATTASDHSDRMIVASNQVTPAVPASALTTPSPASVSESVSIPASSPNSSVWIPPTSKSSGTGSAGPAKVRVANTTWVEKNSGQTDDEWVPKSVQEPAASEAPPTEVPVQKPHHRRHTVKTSATDKTESATASSPAVAAPAPAAEVPSPVVNRTASEATLVDATAIAPPPTAPASSAVSAPTRASENEPLIAASAPEPPQLPPVVIPPAPAKASQAVPSTEELLANPEGKPSGDLNGADHWVPKSTPKPAVGEMPEDHVQVAMVPRSAPSNSNGDMVKNTPLSPAQAAADSDQWAPGTTRAQNSEVDLNQQLERLRQREKQQAVVNALPKARMDVNNPEEGVLPVSSFEKFSGPMYGRHREYERRFYPGKRAKKGIPDHDFYVDEIDRKKETHNVYYYQHAKSKAPKLVAVERHESVSFLGNYDIGKEDSGKLSIYN